MKKWVVFCLLACLLLTQTASANTVEHAKALYDLGLLKGTGDGFSEEGLELERGATRTEICITVVRMLGKEEKANYQQNGHPFTDVPAWGSAAVGWLYENYLVNGVSDTYFGAQDTATVQQFSTMLLRVLGYQDSAGDFSYANATGFAVSIGLLPMEAAGRTLLSRKDMMDMCYQALKTPIKNSKRLLIRKLCDEGAVSESVAKQTGVLANPSISDAFPSAPETLGKISVRRSGPTARLTLAQPAEHYGVRVFVQKEGGGVQEARGLGGIYMEKGEISYLNGGSAGYIREIKVGGLQPDAEYQFIVVKTSSEGELYQIEGKSKPTRG